MKKLDHLEEETEALKVCLVQDIEESESMEKL